MTHRSLRTLLAAGLFIAVGAVATATIVERLTLETMTQRAAVVIHGECLSAISGWVDPVNKRQIYTEYTFRVIESLKGADAEGIFTFRTLGGSFDGQTYQLSGVPRHGVGEEMLLFLTVPHERNNCRMPVGLSQGKFPIRVEDRTERRLVHQDATGIVFLNADQKPDESVTADESLTQEQPLTNLLTQVRSIIVSQNVTPQGK